MKVSKEKVTQNRAAILDAAGRLFRQRGFEQVGIAEIMNAAGLTHGGFYGHFASKEALAAEACECSLSDGAQRLKPGGIYADDLGAFIDSYLSLKHRDRPDGGCPMSAHASEIDHQSASVQAGFSRGVEHYIDAIEELLQKGAGKTSAAERRQKAIGILACVVGGMSLARATARAAPDLSNDILAAVRTRVDSLAK